MNGLPIGRLFYQSKKYIICELQPTERRFLMQCPYCGKEVTYVCSALPLRPFHILFDESNNPKNKESIRKEVSCFSKSYDEVLKIIISNSELNRDTFKINVATLLPTFGMTRRGLFNGVKIENGIQDPNNALDTCWVRIKDELQDLKKLVNLTSLSSKSRAIIELSPELKNRFIVKTSELFDKLEWTTINGFDIGRVAASKILFAMLPEFTLPVDNAEWDKVFRTHSYGRVLSTMTEEINEWEKETKTHLDALDSQLSTTVTSVYNVIAMSVRP